jgi:hypothetical protein
LDKALEDLRGSQPGVPQSILQMADILPGIIQAAEGHLPIFLEYWVHVSRDPELWKAAVAPYQKYKDFFIRMMGEGMTTGSINAADKDTAALAVMSLAIGLLLQGIVDPGGSDWNTVGRESIRMLLDGMTRRSK